MEIRKNDLNPCIGVCQLDHSGCCLGCGRTRNERYSWNRLSLNEQREILLRLLEAQSLFINNNNV